MSLEINAEKVVQIRMASGLTLEIKEGSLTLDSFEIKERDGVFTLRGGQSGICATGFHAMSREGDKHFFGPMSAVEVLVYAEGAGW